MSIAKHRAYKKLDNGEWKIYKNCIPDVYFCNDKELNILIDHGENREVDAIVQFTGRKDKQGAEIYEDDIVKWDVFDFFAMSMTEEKKITSVKFSKGSFVFVLKVVDNITTVYHSDSERLAEVIGNKYQSPELMEEVD